MCVCVCVYATRCSQINKLKKRKNLAKSGDRGVEPRRNGQKQTGRPLAGRAEAGERGMEAPQIPDGELGLGEERQVLGTQLCLL